MDNHYIITEIWQYDNYIGNILFHLESVRRDEDQGSFTLIPMLSILAEKTIKMYCATLNDDEKIYEEKLHTLTKRIYHAKIINDKEFNTLEKLRVARNNYFHGSEHNNGLDINGKFFPLSEADTHKFLYDQLSGPTLLVTLKLLKM